MNNKYFYITLLSLLGMGVEMSAQSVSQVPKLVVCINIQQLRSDHLETFAPLYTKDGLQRFLTEGRVYSNGAYCLGFCLLVNGCGALLSQYHG